MQRSVQQDEAHTAPSILPHTVDNTMDCSTKAPTWSESSCNAIQVGHCRRQRPSTAAYVYTIDVDGSHLWRYCFCLVFGFTLT